MREFNAARQLTAKALLDRLAPVYGQHVAFYAREYAGHPDAETPEQMAEGFAEYSRKVAAETPPRKLTWRHLSAVTKHDREWDFALGGFGPLTALM